jgi:ubiquinone/menaquinone biosynthesis C-methylase UbiE
MPQIRNTREAIQYALPFVTGKVLDAGGGPAAKYRFLLKTKALEYVCLDAQSGGHVDVVGDVLQMPFENETFDTVVCNQVLEHVPRPRALIVEAYRVLKSNGYFICTAPFLEPVHADPGDFFRYTVQGLRALCADQGFRVEESRAYGGLFSVLFSMIKFRWFSPYRKSSRFRRKIGRMTEKLFFALDSAVKPRNIYSDVLIIAQKK